MTSKKITNHIALVLDASTSMHGERAQQLVKVADGLAAHLARTSKELDQETRISVFTFASRHMFKCVVWDTDVLRLPSIAKHYDAYGNTALVDAVINSIEDLDMTPQKYGDHAFLVYVLTDGEENDSFHSGIELTTKLEKLPDNWTVACLVPSQRGVFEAKRRGFPSQNIEVWDVNSAHGVEEVGKRITATTDAYMTMRASGVRGSKALFSTDATAVNKATIQAANLTPLSTKEYKLLAVDAAAPIREWVQEKGEVFAFGKAFYQLTNRSVIVQSQKNIAIREKSTNKVFTGAGARDLIGLPYGEEKRVKASDNPDYDVFVQSTSVNRKLVPGTSLLLLN